jgi:hypothetical protein
MVRGDSMKIGDLVKVKDAHGYNSYMQEFVGHIGIIVKERYNKHWVKVHICGYPRGIRVGDLEVIK